jgi:hypothetical protein
MMADHKNFFTEKLLAQQKVDPSLQEKYRKELTDMLEVKIEGRRKMLGIFIVAIRYVIGLISLFVFFYIPNTLGIYRNFCGILGVVLVTLSIFGAVVILKGVYKHRTHGNIGAAIVFYGFIAAWVALLATESSEPIIAILGTLILIIACTKMILNQMKQSELNTREQLLKQEYRLAEVLPRD